MPTYRPLLLAELGRPVPASMHASPVATIPDDPAYRFAAERSLAVDRLRTAAAISLILHVAALSLRSGDIGVSQTGISQLARSLAGAPAPLNVQLAPRQFELPHATKNGTSSLRPLPVTARAVTDAGSDTGGWSAQRSPAQAAGQAQFGAPAPVYFDAKELTRQPEPLNDIDPDPPALQERSGSGKAILVLFINEAGRLDRVEVETSALGDPLLTAVVAEFQEIRFQPAEIEGAQVKSRLRIEVLVRPIMKP